VVAPASILFVCTHNSARSQFAAALWRQRTGLVADIAGTRPAPAVHPRAVRAAADFGLELTPVAPKGYAAVTNKPDLVVSVCDRARESGLPFAAPSLHAGKPKDGDQRACWALFETSAGKVTVEFRRVANDVEAAGPRGPRHDLPVEFAGQLLEARGYRPVPA
jgi:protein-tyrosine-phosphatase